LNSIESMSGTEEIAEYIARAVFDDLPGEVVEHAKHCISDTVACGLGGRKTLEGEVLIGMMKDLGGKPETIVLGDGARLPFLQAAQVNCVLSNMLDYDDTLIKIGHMSSVLVPVALAIGERIHATGRELINALVLGYETIIRVREAVEPSKKAFWKSFERVGVGIHFGVTAVAGKLFGLDAEQMADALGLTGMVPPLRVRLPNRSRNGMPRWMKITGGDIVIPGIQSALLAQKGFPGDREVLDRQGGYHLFVGSDRYEAAKLTAELGKRYGMLRIGFKYYPACRHISPALDAVSSIVSENGIEVDDVKKVVVKTQRFVTSDFAIYEPKHMIQAQFSVPYTVAMVLKGESPGPNWYTDKMLNDPAARKLQHKIRLEEDNKITDKYYEENKYTATAEIKTKNGAHHVKQVEYPKGEPENRFSRRDHEDKLARMASCCGLEPRRIDELKGRLGSMEEVRDISELAALMIPME
jgi:2-methylcitrate dehydratase PrpD